jgi:uncharacterized protein
MSFQGTRDTRRFREEETLMGRKHTSDLGRVVALVGVLALLLGACGRAEEQPRTFLTMGTASAAGTFYPLGGGMTELINQHIEGVEATARTTPGSSAENVPQLKNGDIEMGMVTADQAYDGYTGAARFDGVPHDGLRGLVGGHSTVLHIAVRADSRYQKVEDLAGARIGSGAPGSLQELMTEAVLEEFGVTDWRRNPLSIADSATAMRDGVIDATFLPAGPPTSAVIDLQATIGVRFLPMPEAKRQSLHEKHPYFAPYTITAGTYEGINEDYETFGVKTLVVVWDKMDEELAYRITKVILENTEALTRVHGAGAHWNVKTGHIGMPIPFHRGAARFWAEHGVTVDAQ